MSDKKEIEVKMYFSDIKHVLDFLAAQNPIENINYEFEDLRLACKNETRHKTDSNLKEALHNFQKAWIPAVEHVSNMLLCLETYLDLQAQQQDENKTETE